MSRGTPGGVWTRVAAWLVTPVALVLAGAGPASADVIVGDAIEVSAPDGSRAVVERSPVRITFFDPDGRRVLSQISSADADTGPTELPGTPQNLFGLPGPAPPTAYRPFSFIVGSFTVNQQTAVPQWYATLQNVVKAGTIYGATEVTGVVVDGDDVVIEISTDDPGGREVVARIGPDGDDGIEVSAEVTPSAGVASLASSFSTVGREAFRGFGGRHNYLDQRGESFYNWLQQQNVSSGSAAGLTAPTDPEKDRYLFPNGSAAAYYVQSSFISNRGYGFLLDRNEISHWRMASDRGDAWQVEVASPKLDYSVLPGTAKVATGKVTERSGRHRVPPRWAQGSLMVRSVNFPGDTARAYVGRVRDDIREIQKTGTPVDAYGIEGWEFISREKLREVIAELVDLGIKPMLYLRVFVGEDEIGTDSPEDYDEALAKGYVATRADGSPYVFTSNFFANAAMIDFTDPAAVSWWQARVREVLELGAKGFMQDFGEQVMTDMHFEAGRTGRTMHNRLAVLAHKATRQELDRWKRETGEKIFFYTRGGYSGTPGAARFEGANFAGDSTTDWTRSAGLASLTTDMLNRGVGGSFGFSTDIGGYFDIGPYESPTSKQLFIRWTEWAALSPLFRLHGSVLAGTHMPWIYDRETVKLYSRFARLHRRARVYVREVWKKAERKGIPVARPLWLQYPHDSEAAKQDQQWMLGAKVMVAPVVVEDATDRRVYFPSGCWEHPETGDRHNGPGYARVDAPLELLPYYFKCGERPFAVTPSCERIKGTPRDDILVGTGAAERIRGRGGEDVIRGRGGADCLNGGPGADRVSGNGGPDRVRPGSGSDRVRTNTGNDYVHGGPGTDRIRAGSGDDFIEVIKGGRDVVNCGPGKDIVLAGGRDRVRNCERTKRR
jgi:alpha-glucosidase